MGKKGQTTLFIILAVSLLLIAGFYFLVSSSVKGSNIERELEEGIKVSANFQPVKNYVDACIKKTTEDALTVLGIQGGFVFFLEGITRLSNMYFDTAYWYFDDVGVPYGKDFVEGQINLFLDVKIRDCVNNFESLNLNIDSKYSNSKAYILDDKIIVKTNYTVTLNQGEDRITNSKYIVGVPVRLGKIIDTANGIVERQKADPDMIDMTYLAELDLDVNLFRQTAQDYLITITDTESTIGGRPYSFAMAMNYKYEVPVEENRAPEIDPIEDLEVKVGEEVLFYVQAYDTNFDTLRYHSVSTLFDIDKNTGMVSFTPTAADIGEHDTAIEVYDTLGESDFEFFKVKVVQ